MCDVLLFQYLHCAQKHFVSDSESNQSQHSMASFLALFIVASHLEIGHGMVAQTSARARTFALASSSAGQSPDDQSSFDKARPMRNSIALPFVVAPALLDGTLAADAGFDPLGFAGDQSTLCYVSSPRPCSSLFVGFPPSCLFVRLPRKPADLPGGGTKARAPRDAGRSGLAPLRNIPAFLRQRSGPAVRAERGRPGAGEVHSNVFNPLSP